MDGIKRLSLAFSVMLLGIALHAQDLIKMGSINDIDEKAFRQECHLNGGKISLFTEDLTWNKCGKFELVKIAKDKYEVAHASLLIGGTKTVGFPCKPETVYEYSIDIKGDAPSLNIKGAGWDKGKTFYQYKAFNPKKVIPTKEWVNIKGTFKTGRETERAALFLQFWESTEWGPLHFKIGDYVLFDNIVVKEKSIANLTQGAPVENAPLKIVKIASTGNCTLNDFVVHRSYLPTKADTSVNITSDKDGINLKIKCQEPVKVTSTDEADLWKGDVVEIFFGPAPNKNDRQLTQFVIAPNGRTWTGRGLTGQTNEVWKHNAKITADGWEIEASIPFASLGWDSPKDGEQIPFNVGRQRVAAKEVQTWSKVRTSFHDVPNFCLLQLGPYPKNMNRKQYEKFDAQKKANAQNEKLKEMAQYTFLVGQGSITDDNTLPYFPDSLLENAKEMHLDVAVNEIRPLVVAIANTTTLTQTYRITLEKPTTGSYLVELPEPFYGTTAREAVAIRDNGTGTGALYDILPRMNEASTISIPAKTARFVVFDINTEDMKPGSYKGNLRITPLTGKGNIVGSYWKGKYEGEMRIIPFTLNVRDIILSKEPARPGAYSAYPANKEIYRLAHDLGQRVFKFSIWSFNWKLVNGEFVGSCSAEKQLDHAREMGIRHLMLAYSTYDVFPQIYGKKNYPLFKAWLKKIGELLVAKGFKLEDCEIEVFDEPEPSRSEEVIQACKIVKETLPQMQSLIAFGAHVIDMSYLEKMVPYVDKYDFWRHGYFSKPEHLAFIKKLQNAGKSIRHYTCEVNPRSSLHSNSRMNAWFGEYHNAESDSMYRLVDDRKGSSWIHPTSGEQLLFIHGGAVPTMRYMALRQGVMDVKYIAKLREVGKDSPEAQAFLKTAAKRVVKDAPHDKSLPDKVREEAAQLIMKLQQAK